MKKRIACVLSVLAFAINLSAQLPENDLYYHPSEPNPIDPVPARESYLKKSRNYSYGAVSMAAVSAGLFTYFACDPDRFEYRKGEDRARLTTRSKVLVISGCVTGFAALLLEIQAIEYRFKSGMLLSAGSHDGYAGVTLTF